MTNERKISIGAAGLSGFLLLVGCNGPDMGIESSRGFAAAYAQARNSLESGNYTTAANRYQAMLSTAGPLETRLRLERAHALLRADRYAAAAQEASVVAASHSDNRRAAALAVVGTAEHRMAQEAMSQGDFSAATVGHLQRARAALKEMLSTSPDLDPLSSMAQRLSMVEASLQNIGT